MKIKEFFSKIFEKTEDVMFPHYVCPFCERETPNGAVCNTCAKHKIQPKYCPVCSEHIADTDSICYECRETDRVFNSSFSVFNYTGSVANAILKFKFNGAKYLAKDFAQLLYDKFKTADISIDVVTSVPSTAKRIKRRGYNQAAELAKEFACLAGLPYAEVLTKTKETTSQKELTKKERLANLKDSFAVADKWIAKGKRILVIDDVFTTGSTLTACASTLKKCKAEKVYCLTLAKTAIKM